MTRSTKILLALIVTSLFVFGAFGVFINIQNQRRASLDRASVVETLVTPAITQVVKPEKGKAIIGTKEVSKGIFREVTGGNIVYDVGGEVVQLPLTIDEVVLACTTQNLRDAKELDYSEIKKIHVLTPDELGAKIPVSEEIVVFAADIEEVFRAHTIAIDASKCEK